MQSDGIILEVFSALSHWTVDHRLPETTCSLAQASLGTWSLPSLPFVSVRSQANHVLLRLILFFFFFFFLTVLGLHCCPGFLQLQRVDN